MDAELLLTGASFLLYLLIPIGAFVMSFLTVPDLDREKDLKRSYYGNRTWFFGLLSFLVLVSLSQDYMRTGKASWDVNAIFRLIFLGLAVASMTTRNPRFHASSALLFLVLFCAYIVLLFLRL